MSEIPSPEQPKSALERLQEEQASYSKLKEVLGGFYFRKEDPPQTLKDELRRLESEIIELEKELKESMPKKIQSDAKTFYSEPLKPLVPEEPKKK